MAKKTQWLDRALFYGVHFTLCTTREGFVEAHKHLTGGNKPEPGYHWPAIREACVHTFEREPASGDIPAQVVCVNAEDVSDPLLICSVIAREAVHIKQEIMRTIGEDSPSKEFEAYVVQNLMRALLEEFVSQEIGRAHV